MSDIDTNVSGMVRDRDLRTVTAPIVHDADGRSMSRFGLSYRHEGRFWAFSVWAYGWADAEARVAAIRESLTIDGEIVAQGDL